MHIEAVVSDHGALSLRELKALTPQYGLDVLMAALRDERCRLLQFKRGSETCVRYDVRLLEDLT